MLSRTCSVARAALVRAPIQPAAMAVAPARCFGSPAHGHGAAHDAHGHGHHPVDPASELPWKYGEHPLKPRQVGSWEGIWNLGWVAVFGACAFVAAYAPNTSPVHWAREEALHTGFKAPEPAPDLED